jgi:hypothetical protein
MLKIGLIKLISTVAIASVSVFATAQKPSRPARTEVLVLGTYHMDNPGRDYVKASFDDHLSPKRQREIEDVVGRLARFRPTKILIESPYGSTKFNERYQAFRAGTYKLTADERDQIAMRLAQRLGHDRLWPIDFKEEMDIDSVMALAPKAAGASTMKAMGEGRAEIGRMFERLPRQTVRQNLLEANSPKTDALTQGLYNLMLRINEEPDNYRGADVVAGWYHRNIRIFANIAKTIQPGDERVLVLIGAGHTPILRQLVRDASDMKLVPVASVLGR